jgi:hypothetical protein
MKKVSVDGLLALTPREIKIIYWRCKGETVEQTANKFPMAASLVYRVLKENIYPTLKVDGWRDIETDLCKPLRAMVARVEDLDNWPEGFREKIEALREPLEPQKAQLDELEEFPDMPAPQFPPELDETITSEQERRVRNRPFWILVAVPILIVCALAIFGLLFGVRYFQTLVETAISRTQVAQQTLVGQTESVPPVSSQNTEAIPSPLLPSPIESLETAAVDTQTPAPTRTAIPTATTNPNIFLDNFSDGLDPAWTVVQGKPAIVNGKLTVTETTVLSIGDASWKDYEIEFDILVPGNHCTLTATSEYIGVRSSDLDNMLKYAFSWCNGEWRYLINGQQTTIPNTHTTGLKEAHVAIRVEGNQVIVHRQSELITTLINEDFPTGYIFLKLARDTLIDDFKVTLLNQ